MPVSTTSGCPHADEPTHFLLDHLARHTATGATRERHDAEGAAVLAAILDLDEGARAALDAAHPARDLDPRRADVADLHARRTGHALRGGLGIQQRSEQIGQPRLVGVADDQVHAAEPRHVGGIRLRPAAGHHHPRPRTVAPRPADRLAIGEARRAP